MHLRLPTRVAAAQLPTLTVSLPAAPTLRRCFVNGQHFEGVTSEGVAECSIEDVPEVLSRGPVTVQELVCEIGVSRQVAFRLQQQYWCRSVEEVKEGCFELQKVLQINIEEAAMLASKEPRLLASPHAVKQSFEALRSALGDVTPIEAGRIVVYTPSLLCIPAIELQAKFQVLLDSLDVPRQDLCSLVAMQPNVLTTPVERVAKRVSEVSMLLAPMTAAQAVCLLYSFPSLMVEDMGRLTDKMAALQALLQAEYTQVVSMVLRYPPVLMTTTEVTESRLVTTADLLGVPQSSVYGLALSCPGIFTLPANILREHFEKVFGLFGHMDRDVVMELIAKNPALLGLEF